MSTPINIPFNFQVGFPVVAQQHNSNNTEIANFCTSLQNGTNFGTGVIGTATITAGAITTALIADGNVTSAKLAGSLALTTPNIGVATATQLTVGITTVPLPANGVVVQGNVVYHLEINAQTISYTLALSDDGKLITVDSATGVNITIPTNATVAFPIGTQITFLQMDAGQITFIPAVGATVIGNPGVKTRAIWTGATLIQRAANTWVVVGDLAV